jgi:hypothetical protein
MPSEREPDNIVRRIVVEYGRVYVYAYVTDGSGRILDEDVFKQPYRLDKADAVEEAKDLYDVLYDTLNEGINFPSASAGDEGEQSE